MARASGSGNRGWNPSRAQQREPRPAHDGAGHSKILSRSTLLTEISLKGAAQSDDESQEEQDMTTAKRRAVAYIRVSTEDQTVRGHPIRGFASAAKPSDRAIQAVLGRGPVHDLRRGAGSAGLPSARSALAAAAVATAGLHAGRRAPSHGTSGRGQA